MSMKSFIDSFVSKVKLVKMPSLVNYFNIKGADFVFIALLFYSLRRFFPYPDTCEKQIWLFLYDNVSLAFMLVGLILYAFRRIKETLKRS